LQVNKNAKAPVTQILAMKEHILSIRGIALGARQPTIVSYAHER
jgi:hypothetical protein